MVFTENVMPLGAWRCTGKEQENSSGFQGIQAVCSRNYRTYVTAYSYAKFMICVHMPYNPFSVPNRVRKLSYTDACVITECSIMHYNKSCGFFFPCTVFEYDKFRTQS